MIVQKVIGTLAAFDPATKTVDYIALEWYETGKKILHKKTTSGRDIVLRLINETQTLKQDDVVYGNGDLLIAIDIKPCAVMVLQPKTMYEMAAVVYEIGNKHLPLFYEHDQLLVPFEKPLFQMLQAAGFAPEQAERKLLHPLRTTVSPHGHSGASLFSRILQMTSNHV